MNIYEIKEKSAALFEQGKSPLEISQELDIPLRGVQRALEPLLHERAKARVPPLREEGLTYREICSETGLSQRTVWKILTREGLVEKSPGRKLGRDDQLEIKYRLFTGEEAEALAEEYGVSKSYVYTLGGGELGPSKSRLADSTKEEIARMYLVEGLTPAEISVRTGTSVNTVYAHRFRDPILFAEWHKGMGLTFDRIKGRFFFAGKQRMSFFHEVWRAHNRDKEAITSIAERTGVSLGIVRGIAKVETSSAYRAAWELLQRGGK